MFKYLLAAASFTATIVGNAVSAAPIPAGHVRLVQSLRDAGYSVVVNHETCDRDDVKYGFYYRGNIVICQTNVAKGTRSINHDWNSEDLDTLRHEAHHAIQDCMDGRNFDGELSQVYDDPFTFARNIIGVDGIRAVRSAYSDEDYATQVLEVEAFAVAADNDTNEQVSDVYRFCVR